MGRMVCVTCNVTADHLAVLFPLLGYIVRVVSMAMVDAASNVEDLALYSSTDAHFEHSHSSVLLWKKQLKQPNWNYLSHSRKTVLGR